MGQQNFFASKLLFFQLIKKYVFTGNFFFPPLFLGYINNFRSIFFGGPSKPTKKKHFFRLKTGGEKLSLKRECFSWGNRANFSFFAKAWKTFAFILSFLFFFFPFSFPFRFVVCGRREGCIRKFFPAVQKNKDFFAFYLDNIPTATLSGGKRLLDFGGIFRKNVIL